MRKMYNIMTVAKFHMLIVAFSLNIARIHSHGYLIDPPARTSAWRVNPTDFPVNYNDNQMNCGGFDVEWNQNSKR